jgi:hypothetical protein
MKTKRNAILFEVVVLLSLLLFVAACMGLMVDLVSRYNENREHCIQAAITPLAVAQCR